MCKEKVLYGVKVVKGEVEDTLDMLSAEMGRHGPSIDETLDRYYNGEIEYEDVARALRRDGYRQMS